MIHPILAKVTQNLTERSREARAAFIARSQAQEKSLRRSHLTLLR